MATDPTQTTDPNDLVRPPKQVEAPGVEKVDVSESDPEKDPEPSPDLEGDNPFKHHAAREPREPSFRGWKEIGRWEVADALTEQDALEDLTVKNTILDQYLPPLVYGDWYHNVGYLLVGGLLSWFVGWLRFLLAPVFFITLPLALVYRASIRKYRSTIREQVQREFSVKAIEDDYETLDYFNTMMDKYWVYLEPLIALMVCEQANPILAALPAPAFIKSLWIDSFTVGTKPFRVDRVKTLNGTDKDIVVMDWGVLFTPNSLADASNKQMKNKVNQKITVKAKLFGFVIPVVIQDASFNALFRVRFRLMPSYPHIKTINVSLLEAPEFDCNSKVLLGDNVFNWEVFSIPGLYPFVNQMVKKYVGAMLYLPLLFQLNVEQLMAGNSLDAAIGVLAIKVQSAKNLKGYYVRGNTMDPYLRIGFKNDVLAKTKYKPDTDAPVWNEIHYIPVVLLSEPLNITVVDKNDRHKDREVGVIQFDLEALYHKPQQDNLTSTFVRNSKNVGTLSYSLNFMPTIEPIRHVDGAVTPAPDLNTGIMRLEIADARHLVGNAKDMKLRAEIYIDHQLKKKSSDIKGLEAPMFGVSHEEIIFNRSKTRVRIVLKNKEKIYGQILSTLNNLIDASQVEENWFPFSKGGELSVRTTWKPVGLSDASGSGGFTPPIGVVRVDVEKAEDLRNLERVGKVDPYARLLINGVEKGRTIAIDADLNPVWNEIHYLPITSANQKLTVDVMDVEKVAADRTLGSFDVKLNEIINKDESGKFIQWIDEEKRESKLIHKKGPKGVVTYTLSFYPTLPVKTLEDIQDEKDAEEAEQKRIAEEKEKEKKALADGASKKEIEKSKKEAEEADEEMEGETVANNSKVQLSVDELAEHQSGVLVAELLDGTFSKDDVYLHVFFDNRGYHDFVSSKITKKKASINSSFETVITELDWSKALFRLLKDKDDNRLDKAIAEATITSQQLLKNGYTNPTTIQLNGAASASIKLQVQWFPIIFKDGIPIQDSYKNSGILTATAIRATGLPAGDRNGKLDPYIKLFLNNEKDHFLKSKKIKKTLEPLWNESESTEVYNLYDSVIGIEVYDWDIGPEQDDLLGTAQLAMLEYDAMNNNDEVEVPLVGEDGHSAAGSVFLSFSFKTSNVLNIRKKTTSLDPTPAGAVRGVGKGLTKGIGGIGGGIGGGAKLLKRGLHLGKVSEDHE